MHGWIGHATALKMDALAHCFASTGARHLANALQSATQGLRYLGLESNKVPRVSPSNVPNVPQIALVPYPLVRRGDNVADNA